MYFWAAWRIFSRSMDKASTRMVDSGAEPKPSEAPNPTNFRGVGQGEKDGTQRRGLAPVWAPTANAAWRSAATFPSKVLTTTDVERAQARIAGRVRRTPLSESAALSRLAGCQVHLKLENLQFTGSFKERGAASRLLVLSEAERARGVITASAGNHAQALALHASRLGVVASVVMPEATPLVKVQATEGYGAPVRLHGSGY